MATERQIAANRLNARKSTGPRTPHGKAVSRMNAYRHGMRSLTIVIPGEDHDLYDRIYAAMCREYQAHTEPEQFLVRQMVDAQWRLERLKGIETALLDQPEIDTVELDRISRWQVRLENSYYKAQKALQALGKHSRPPSAPEDQPKTVVSWWTDPPAFEPHTSQFDSPKVPPLS